MTVLLTQADLTVSLSIVAGGIGFAIGAALGTWWCRR